MLGWLLKSKPLVTGILRTTDFWRCPCTKDAQILLQTRRTLCNKEEATKKVISQTAIPGRATFRNDRRPTAFDKKILLWAGRFKKEEDIPVLVSSEVIKAATNRVRIKICYITMALTLLGCLVMISSGKQAARRDDTLLRMNTEKKAMWRAEAETELEAAAMKTQ
ncbi:protein FAM162B-like [Dermochelys coriacea]|uniref:protein FAM162B-like n=1 Tax=Dermochelys coriacea TaxID=27794 RepID=UPI0018E78265|nr:protein FAM162B-like [Dermochelys coriacea]